MNTGYNTTLPIFEQLNEMIKDVYLGISQKIFGKERPLSPRATGFDNIDSFVTQSTYDALLSDRKLDSAFYEVWQKDLKSPGVVEKYQKLTHNKKGFKENSRFIFNVDNGRKREIASRYYISDKRTLENKTE